MSAMSKSSKYDFVKVRVRLGEHHYILSRFIVSRILTVIKVKSSDSVKISLELKKKFVDAGELEVKQEVLEKELFALLQQYDYGDHYIERFKMMSRFHHERVPLLILVAGTGITGKSTLATKLAENLNIPNILSTEILRELMSVMGVLPSKSLWWREFESDEQMEEVYKKESEVIRKALEGDIEKCFVEGKSVIIEGVNVNPSLFNNLAQVNLLQPPSQSADIGQRKRGIIVPVIVYMHESDHKLFLEHWLDVTTEGKEKKCNAEQVDALFHKIKHIENYIMGESTQNAASGGLAFTPVQLSLRDLSDTSGKIQSAVLNAIDTAYKANAF